MKWRDNKMNVLIKQTCMTFSPVDGTIESVSYSTTLSAKFPVTDVILIIEDFVKNCISHVERINNANYTIGTFASLSTDGDTYSFAIKGEPETNVTEFDFEIEV